MNEKTKRRIVFSMFIMLAVIVLCLGVLLAVYNYEASMASEDSVLRDWKLHTCCCGTCEYSDEELKMQFIMLTAETTLSIALGSLAVTIWLYNKGRNYYRDTNQPKRSSTLSPKLGAMEMPTRKQTRAEGEIHEKNLFLLIFLAHDPDPKLGAGRTTAPL